MGEIYYDECGCDFAGRAKIDELGNIDDESYGYNEGMYKLMNEDFWETLDNDMETGREHNKDVDSFVNGYPFLSEEDKVEMRKLYTEYLEENPILELDYDSE